MNFEWIGLLAALCTTGAFVPQVYHTWRSRCTKNLSLTMLITSVSGTLIWFVYGNIISSTSIIISSGMTSLLQMILLHYKLRYR